MNEFEQQQTRFKQELARLRKIMKDKLTKEIPPAILPDKLNEQK